MNEDLITQVTNETEAQTRPDRWPENDLLVDDLLTMECPEPKFIVPGLFRERTTGRVFGEGASYKSLAMLWLAVQYAVADSFPSAWLDKFPLEKSGKVVFGCFEDETNDDLVPRLQAVIAALAKKLNIPLVAIHDELKKNLRIFRRESFFDGDPSGIIDDNGDETPKFPRLLNTIVEINPKLLIIDTRSRISHVPENDNTLAAREEELYTRLRDASGAAVLTVCHTNKSSRKGHENGSTALRGASSGLDNSRFGLWFQPVETKDGVERIKVINAKNSRTRRSVPFTVRIDWPEMTLDMNAGDDDAVENERMEKLLDWIKTNPGHATMTIRARKDVKKLLNIGSNGINMLIKMAITEGSIYKKRDGKMHGLFYKDCT